MPFHSFAEHLENRKERDTAKLSSVVDRQAPFHAFSFVIREVRNLCLPLVGGNNGDLFNFAVRPNVIPSTDLSFSTRPRRRIILDRLCLLMSYIIGKTWPRQPT